MTIKEQRHGTWPHLVGDNGDWKGLYQAMVFMVSNEFRLEALMEAAGSSEIRDSRNSQIHSGHLRRIIITPQGTITIAPGSGARYGVMEADLPADEYKAFWERLKEQADRDPGVQKFRQLGWQGDAEREKAEAPTTPAEPDYSERTRLYRDEAIMAAAQADSIRRSRDPVSYRCWRIDAHQGSRISFWDTGNRWSRIEEVDLPPEQAEVFWKRLREYVESHTDRRPGDISG